jgi:thiol:disulfide interchange protein DsbC
MRRILFTLLLMLLLMPAAAIAFGGCEENCQKCHSLSNDEVKQITTKLGAANAKPLDIKMSPIQGLWEVKIDDSGRQGIMYVGFSKKHVIAGPIYEVDTGMNKTLESIEKMRQESPHIVDVSKIPFDRALVVGEKDAKQRVFLFTDPDCPYCAKAHEEIRKVVAERKDIVFFLKLMPLSFHPEAYWKSQSILCRNSISMLEANFEKKEIPKPDCEDRKEIDNNLALAKELGITGTPTFVMPDGTVIIGVRDAKAIIELAVNPKQKGETK